MAEQAGAFEVKVMGRMLGVSASAYYAWRGRQPSTRERANAELLSQIQQAYKHRRGTYGSPRIVTALRAKGIVCNHKRVVRIMRVHGIQGVSCRRNRPTTTDSKHTPLVAPNVLNRDFTARAPNQKWLGDITYIDTLEGLVYPANLEDVILTPHRRLGDS